MFNLFGTKSATHEVITPQQAEQRIKESKPLVIDVREQYEYASGHIKGSKLIPLGQLGHSLEALGSKEQAIIVVCQSGSRSNHAANMLTSKGFTNVADIRGGMGNWMRLGLPVQK